MDYMTEKMLCYRSNRSEATRKRDAQTDTGKGDEQPANASRSTERVQAPNMGQENGMLLVIVRQFMHRMRSAILLLPTFCLSVCPMSVLCMA